MKEMKVLSMGLSLIMALLFTGCSSDDDPAAEPEKEVAYAITYSVSEISEDLLTCGAAFVTYADKDGKEQTVELTKDNVPFSVKVEGLKSDSRLFFDLIFGYNEDVKLTKDKYTFAKSASYSLKGTDGSSLAATLASGSVTVGKEKVRDYMLEFINKDFTLDSTAKKLLSK